MHIIEMNLRKIADKYVIAEINRINSIKLFWFKGCRSDVETSEIAIQTIAW